MTLQDAFRAAGIEYGDQIEATKEATRLAAIELEASHANNAAAFAASVEGMFTDQFDTDSAEGAL